MRGLGTGKSCRIDGISKEKPNPYLGVSFWPQRAPGGPFCGNKISGSYFVTIHREGSSIQSGTPKFPVPVKELFGYRNQNVDHVIIAFERQVKIRIPH